MIIKYIANDGTEFDNEETCRAYEFEKQLSCITMYDCERNPIRDVYHCRFVKLINETCVSTFEEVLKIRGLITYGLDKPGVYMWTCDGEWINLDEVIIDIRGGK